MYIDYMAVFGSICMGYDGRITRLHFNGMFGYKDAIDLPFIFHISFFLGFHFLIRLPPFDEAEAEFFSPSTI